MFSLLPGPGPAALLSKANSQETSAGEKEISFTQGYLEKMEREAVASEPHLGELRYRKGQL